MQAWMTVQSSKREDLKQEEGSESGRFKRILPGTNDDGVVFVSERPTKTARTALKTSPAIEVIELD